VEDKLTTAQLTEFRKKLSTMSITAVMDAYRGAYFQCEPGGCRATPESRSTTGSRSSQNGETIKLLPGSTSDACAGL
jgi:hypothetical protein